MELTWSERLDPVEAGLYDSFVEQAWGGHVCQTRAWEPLATAGRPLVARYFVARQDGVVVGAALVTRRVFRWGPLSLVSPVARVERGPVCARVEQLPLALRALVRMARRRGILKLEVAPYWTGPEAEWAGRALRAEGFRPVGDLEGPHAATLVVDLTRSPQAWLATPQHKRLRQELRRAERAGAVGRRGQPHEVWHLERLHRELMARQGRPARPAPWFQALEGLLVGPRAALFLCEWEGETLSAVLATRHALVATYLLGASQSTPRSFSRTAPALGLAIAWAREQGCTHFDLGGVPLEQDRDPKRLDIARFKRLFSRVQLPLVPEHRRWTWLP